MPGKPIGEDELYSRVMEWAGGTLISENLRAYPIGEFDISEDEKHIVSWFYYAVPKLLPARQGMEFFLFYEENLFLKAKGGELVLEESQIFV